MMQYYKAKIRLAGNTLNEVQKTISAPEVLILQYIHGVDCMASLEPETSKNINLRDEKNRLKVVYDQALIKRETSVDKIFGPLGQVPTVLPDEILERYDIIDEDDIAAVARAATRKQMRPASGNDTRFISDAEQERKDRVIPTDEVNFEDLAE